MQAAEPAVAAADCRQEDSRRWRLSRWAIVVWPAFLTACLLEAAVFALVDPREMHGFGAALQSSRMATYSVAFIAFWITSMASSALVLWLAQPQARPQEAARDLSGRPAG